MITVSNKYQHLQEIERRRVPENPNVKLRLQRFEKPNDWDVDFLKRIYDSIPISMLQRYPDCDQFYTTLSEFIEVPEPNIVVTSGIDEAIRNLILLKCDETHPFFTNAPAYAMYQVYAKILKVDCHVFQPLPDQFMTPEKMMSIFPRGVGLVFIANPGQPVENCYSLDQLRLIAEYCNRDGKLLIIDEAYHFFGAPNAIPLIHEFDNLIILRSFSKAFGAASLRLGYAIGPERAIKPLQVFRLAHEGSSFSYHVGCALIDSFDNQVKPNIQNISAGRDYFRDACRKLGLRAWGELGNFVLLDLETKGQMKKVVMDLKADGIFVKANYPDPLSTCISITAGSKDMMELVISVLEAA